jgi:hypothetical protein
MGDAGECQTRNRNEYEEDEKEVEVAPLDEVSRAGLSCCGRACIKMRARSREIQS